MEAFVDQPLNINLEPWFATAAPPEGQIPQRHCCNSKKAPVKASLERRSETHPATYQAKILQEEQFHAHRESTSVNE